MLHKAHNALDPPPKGAYFWRLYNGFLVRLGGIFGIFWETFGTFWTCLSNIVNISEVFAAHLDRGGVCFTGLCGTFRISKNIFQQFRIQLGVLDTRFYQFPECEIHIYPFSIHFVSFVLHILCNFFWIFFGIIRGRVGCDNPSQLLSAS